MLIYGSKSPVTQAFKILGHVPVRSLLTENNEHNAFTIFGGQRAITVSSTTTAEKTLWLSELAQASADIKSRPHVQLPIGSLKNCSKYHTNKRKISTITVTKMLTNSVFLSPSRAGSSEEGLETCGLNSVSPSGTLSSVAATSTPNKSPLSNTRSNTALHVCWHRGATVGLRDFLTSSEHHLSGYLLRKFKNSSGWQKLWVVFTSFCLYFYKNYQDEFALASLPLLGWVDH